MGTPPDESIDEPRLDRTQFSVARLTDPDDALAYWLSRPVEERLRALERLRRISYGDTVASERLQRVLEVARLERR
jgi:HAMP domain-containing protein